jgi:GT2 family glycosyltransferase
LPASRSPASATCAGTSRPLGATRSEAIIGSAVAAADGADGTPSSLINPAARRHRARTTFRPQWVGEVELTAPLSDHQLPLASDGSRYQSARLLVRNRGQPVGFLELELATGWLIAAQVRAAIDVRSWEMEDAGASAAPAAPACADIGVIVCTRDRLDSLRATLTSILNATPGPQEVIVVDSAPATDGARALIEELEDSRLRYAVESIPGLSRARNRGIAEARCGIVAFTDDDVIVDRGWLAAIARGFERGTEIACVTGFVAPAELDTPAQQMFESMVGWGASYRSRVWELSEPPADDPLFPYTSGKFGAGANFALRKDAVRELGGFDEALGAGTPSGGGEDLDMFLRVLLHDRKLAYEPAALVWHRHRREQDAAKRQLFGYSAGLSAYAYKQLLGPSTRKDVVRRIPRALVRAVSLVRDDRQAPTANRRSLWTTQLRGYACGPALYARGGRRLDAPQRPTRGGPRQ